MDPGKSCPSGIRLKQLWRIARHERQGVALGVLVLGGTPDPMSDRSQERVILVS